MIELATRQCARVLVISDTHGHLDPRIIAEAGDCDLVVHAGDVGAGVAERLRERFERILMVAGNNDGGTELPLTATVRLPGGLLAVEHGDRHGAHQPDHAALRASHPDARLIVYGHSHKQVIDQTAQPWVANPGAAGRARTQGGASCLVVTARTRRWELEAMRWPEQATT